MRTFLLAVFWFTTLGNAVQFLVIASAGWFIFSGDYSFVELNVDVFVTQIVPWLLWLKTLVLALLGEIGTLILTIPILIIAPIKIIFGTVIGYWAYSVAKGMPVKTAYA